MSGRAVYIRPDLPVLLRHNPRARRMTLRISNATGDVSLTVPKGVSRLTAERFARKMEGWVVERLQKRPVSLDVAYGTEFPLEGRLCRIETARGRRVEYADGRVGLPGPEPRLAGQLKGFLKTRARDRLAAAAAHYANEIGKEISAITLRDPRTRWGSCTSDGRLMFSWRLIMAPPEVLDYVAAHEVAHLKELNHSKAFWSLVDGMMPDYRSHQSWLQENGGELHRLQV